MGSLPLPEHPTGTEFEELVSASLQCQGYFLQRNVKERVNGREVLELDAVATDYGESLPHILLAEAKSKGCGFAELFKLYGWMNYLGLEDGVLYTSGTSAPGDFLVSKAGSLAST